VRTCIGWAFIFSTILGLPADAQPTGNAGTNRGSVFDPSGAAIKGASVPD
jgi:hypothetical protein